MTILNIQGQQVEVSDDFLALTPEQQNVTVEEIAQQMDIRPEGKPGLFTRIGERLSKRVEAFEEQAVEEGAFLPGFVEPRDILRGAGLVTGGVVDIAEEVVSSGFDILTDIASAVTPDVIEEPIVDFVSDIFEKAVGTDAAQAAIAAFNKGIEAYAAWEERNPEFARDIRDAANVALVTIPVKGKPGVPTTPGKPGLIGRGVARAREAAAPVIEALAPQTEAGAREVAGRRLRGLVGGRERAGALATRIDPKDRLGLTPAQQLEDPNLLGLQRAAAAEDPLLRERLLERTTKSREEAATAITKLISDDPALKGTVVDARDFFTERLTSFKRSMGEKVERVISAANIKVTATGARLPETEISKRMVARIKDSLEATLIEEKAIWNKVPKGTLRSTQGARETVAELIATTGRAKQKNIPAEAIRLLGRRLDKNGDPLPAGRGQIQDIDSVGEMLDLYSDMRQLARNAMAGDIKNKNQARMANKIADSILDDLGVIDAETAVGVATNNALAFSRVLHETFDRGAVGRILRRSPQATEAIPAGVALEKTIGIQGAGAKISSEGIRKAAADTELDIADFLRGKFTNAVVSASEEFTPKIARNFLRNNKELFNDFPELRVEFRKATESRNAAAMFETRAAARAKLIEDDSAMAIFKLGQEEKAVRSIIAADDPAKMAKSLMASAKRDASGLATSGIKSAFKDYLLGGGILGEELSGRQLTALLKDRPTRAALKQIFSTEEMKNLEIIVRELAKVDPIKVAAVGAVMAGPANMIVETVARVAGAIGGAKVAKGTLAGGIQAANIFSERARAFMRRMTNTKARQLLKDAVEDPVLMKILLSAPETIAKSPEVRRRLAPYLTRAAVVGVVAEGEEE